jgi:hypothetical protein
VLANIFCSANMLNETSRCLLLYMRKNELICVGLPPVCLIMLILKK